jgi:GT2 family glycosyltransferase
MSIKKQKNCSISIIIVQYRVKEELFNCIQSIIYSKPKTTYEIIVVDNDEVKTIKKDLLRRFPEVVYIPNVNKGFGQGNNVGAKRAKGEYLFFLNPDTIVFKKSIDVLYQFLGKNKKAGIVAPFLLHEDEKPFKQQGVKDLTPFRAVFSISVINKFFPNNPIAKNYFIQWDKITTKEVDVVPGTAFMINKKLYSSFGGFDEHFFLYFEEFDLCKRVKEKGYKLFIEPKAKIIHLWERSTKKRNDINKIFNESRFYYFKKNFGLIPALFTNAFLSFGKTAFISLLILLLAAFLLFYQLNQFMDFISDQGWFYLSARDMLLTGHIPLVGITSSHTWLHQGPLWTYLLAGALYIGKFNPVYGAYLTASIGLLTVWLVYKIGSEIFSPSTGIIASLFYATSPLIIHNARMPYHTSLIPIFTLIWTFVLYKWVTGYKYGFPMLIVILAILYNFELSMVVLAPILIIILFYGLAKKTQWARGIITPKILLLSFIGLIIPMIPIILYDIHHGYPQTLKFGIWIIYKSAFFLHIPVLHSDIPGETYQSMFSFASIRIPRLIFISSAVVSWIILLISFINLLIINYNLFKRRKFLQQFSILLLLFVIPLFFYIAEKTNSDAYWPVFFPTIAFMVGIFFDRMLSFRRFYYLFIGLLIFFTCVNVWAFIGSNYLKSESTLSFYDRIAVAKQIIKESDGKEYNILGNGTDNRNAIATLNYQYLTWWLGHGPSNNNQKIHFYISEQGSKIIVQKKYY